MKKVLLPIFVIAIILSMSDCSDDSNGKNTITLPNGVEVDPDTGLTPDGYYPYEVSNVSHERPSEIDAILKWTNPTDSNFSHVIIPRKGYPNPGENSCHIFIAPGTGDSYALICVDKQGNQSKGYIYRIWDDEYDPLYR
jgi:hypothetical protein